MTEEKTEEMNMVLDSIYSKMLEAGFERGYLNKAFIAFNLLTFIDGKDTFKYVLRQLRGVNEKIENYEICAFINQCEKQLEEIKD